MSGFRIERLDDETWRDAVVRYSRPFGMDMECLADFQRNLDEGDDEASAAFHALYEWDCAPLSTGDVTIVDKQ